MNECPMINIKYCTKKFMLDTIKLERGFLFPKKIPIFKVLGDLIIKFQVSFDNEI